MFLRGPGEREREREELEGEEARQQSHKLYGTLKAFYDSRVSRRPPTSRKRTTHPPGLTGYVVPVRRFLRYDVVDRGHAKSTQRISSILICVELVCMPRKVLSKMRHNISALKAGFELTIS